jgi:hypothetical protein
MSIRDMIYEDLITYNSHFNIIRLIKWKQIEWAEQAARMEMKNM